MVRLTLRQQLFGLSALGLVLMCAAASVGLWSLNQTNVASHVEEARLAMFAMLVLSALLPLFVGLTVSKYIGKSLSAIGRRVERLRTTDVAQLASAIDALSRGDLSVRVEVRTPKLYGDTKDEIGAMAKTVNGIIDQVTDTARAYERASERLAGVIGQANAIAAAAKAGRLGERGDVASLEGSYRELVANINATLAAVANPIDEASTVLEQIARRDLSARVVGDHQGDFAKIKTAINLAVQNLDEALGEVVATSDQVESAATRIASGSQALAHGSSEQTSSLEEVSSSLQEMASMAKQSAVSAKDARGIAEDAKSGTMRGVESMERLTKAMDRIKASSDATAKIVKTIDEIAFQTNLLALNAAVEAARAGEAGKGFAVVADEVRGLAMRSAEAAKSTAQLIEEAVKNAEGGVQITEEVVKNLGDISASVVKVSDVMGEIAAASDRQTQDISQVNAAVTQMATITQQNAASSEESAAAAEELSSQAEGMRDMVNEFNISSRTAWRAPVPSAKMTNSIAKSGRAPAMPTMQFMANAESKTAKQRSSNLASVSPEVAIPFHDDGDDDTLTAF